jgi:hypothetical protein
MMTKRTEITIETARVTVISKPNRMFGLCIECRQEVDWVTIDEAARLTTSSSRDVFRMIEEREVHATETEDRILMVCAVSLMRSRPVSLKRS